MTDITGQTIDGARTTPSSNLTHSLAKGLESASVAELFEYAELLFFAYRDFIADADEILVEHGFGRAHHRVLHFVSRNPGMRVADLLEILKITKQSLGRVLKQLVDKGFIEQRAGTLDRRERLLFTTDRGAELADQLAAPQLKRLAEALAAAGPGAEDLTRLFLYNMIKDAERSKVSRLIGNGKRQNENAERSQ